MDKDLRSKSLRELKEIANRLDLSGISRLTKVQLINKIEEVRQQTKERAVDILAKELNIPKGGKNEHQLMVEIKRRIKTCKSPDRPAVVKCTKRLKREIEETAKDLDIPVRGKTKEQLCKQIHDQSKAEDRKPSAGRRSRKELSYGIEEEDEPASFEIREGERRKRSSLFTTKDEPSRIMVKREPVSATNPDILRIIPLLYRTNEHALFGSFEQDPTKHSNSIFLSKLQQVLITWHAFVSEGEVIAEHAYDYPENQGYNLRTLVHFKGLSGNEALLVIVYSDILSLWESNFEDYTEESQFVFLKAMLNHSIFNIQPVSVTIQKIGQPKRKVSYESIEVNDLGSFRLFTKLWWKLLHHDTITTYRKFAKIITTVPISVLYK